MGCTLRDSTAYWQPPAHSHAYVWGVCRCWELPYPGDVAALWAVQSIVLLHL